VSEPTPGPGAGRRRGRVPRADRPATGVSSSCTSTGSSDRRGRRGPALGSPRFTWFADSSTFPQFGLPWMLR